jgi:hypothetical protein
MADNKVLDALKERIAASIQGKLAKNKFDQMFDIDENKYALDCLVVLCMHARACVVCACIHSCLLFLRSVHTHDTCP